MWVCFKRLGLQRYRSNCSLYTSPFSHHLYIDWCSFLDGGFAPHTCKQTWKRHKKPTPSSFLLPYAFNYDGVEHERALLFGHRENIFGSECHSLIKNTRTERKSRFSPIFFVDVSTLTSLMWRHVVLVFVSESRNCVTFWRQTFQSSVQHTPYFAGLFETNNEDTKSVT